MIGHRVLSEALKHAVEKGLIWRLHDLRHHHASGLLQANVHPKIVAERLGHSTIAITLDTYTHTVPSLQQQAALDFAEVMKFYVASGHV